MFDRTALDQSQPSSRGSLARAWVLACVANVLFGCAADSGERVDPEQSKSAEAGAAAPAMVEQAASPKPAGPMTDAYAALVRADYDALPDLIARLDAEAEQDPNNARVALYAGTMRLWYATGGTRTLGQQFNDTLAAIKELERGRELAPRDAHLGAFLGVAQVAFGNTTGDEDRMQRGKQILEESVPLYPSYLLGVLAQALGMTPRKHPFFFEAADTIMAAFVKCGVDAREIETKKFTYIKQSSQGACWNGGVVAHLVEGISLIAGDIFVKQGDVESGRLMYENAKVSPTYDRWLFGEELDRRIAEAEERAALYEDEDPENDPETWMEGSHLCVGCHANKR